MDTATIIILSLSGLLLGQWRAFVKLHGEAQELRRSKDDLRERMSNTNYDLHQGIERLKREKHEQRKKLMTEIHALRTQLHQLRMKQQKQDN